MGTTDLLILAVDLPAAGEHRPAVPTVTAVVRPLTAAQTSEIGALYWRAYPAGVAGPTEAEAVEDVAAAFAGLYGPLWDAGSLAAVVEDRIVAVVMTVHRPVWPDTPDGPFLIELFTDPVRRRTGLAAELLRAVLTAAATAGETTVGLRVRTDNTTARSLYRSFGFHDFDR